MVAQTNDKTAPVVETDDDIIARGERLKAERDAAARKLALERADEDRRMNPFADLGISNEQFGPLISYIIRKHHGQDVAAFLEDRAKAKRDLA